MAVVLDQISLSTLKMYETEMNTRLLSRDSKLLRTLQDNGSKETGSPIDVKVRYKRNNGGSYDGFDTFNTTRVEQFAGGSLEWKSNYVNVTVDESTLVKNAGMNIKQLMGIDNIQSLPVKDKHTIFNLFGKEFESALDDMSTLLATQIWGDGTGNGGKDITGIRGIAGASANTYAGMAGTSLGTFDYAGLLSGSNDNIWAGRYKDLSSASITLDVLSDGINDTKQGGAEGVNEVYCPLDVYASIELQLEGQKVRQNETAAAIGFRQNIEWVTYGVTFYPDPYCPANTIIGVDTRHTQLMTNPGLDMEFGGFKEPTDQAAIVGQLKTMNQLYCNDRAKNFRLDNVNP
jgi:hypothetical protein